MIRSFVRDGDERYDAEMRRVFTAPPFTDPPRDQSKSQAQHRTYEQLRHLNDVLGLAERVRRDRRILFTTLEWVAVVNPALFLTTKVHYGVCLAGIDGMGRSGTEVDRARAELESGQAVGTILITELGHGTSHVALRTRADYDPSTKTFVLRTPEEAARKFMAHAGLEGVPKIGMVYAQLYVHDVCHGVFPFLVRLRDRAGTCSGVCVGPVWNSEAVSLDYTLVRFDGVRVPFDCWLSDGAELTSERELHDPAGSPQQRLLRSLQISRNASAAGAMGLAAVTRATTAITLRYLHHRITSGKLAPGATAIRHGGVQTAVFGSLATAMAITAQVNRARELVVSGERAERSAETTWSPWASVHDELALTKVAATWAAERVTRDCRTSLGAQGILEVNRVRAYEGLASVYHSAAGDNSLTVLDLARSLTLWAHPPAPRESPAPPTGDVSELPVCVELTRLRENMLHTRLCTRLGAMCDRSEFERWNENTALAWELVRAHAHRRTLEEFRARTERLPEGEPRELLRRLCLVYALEELHSHAEQLLLHEWVTPAQQRRIAPTLGEQFRALLEAGPHLLDEAGLDDEVLPAPIASADYITAMTAASSP
ncbi:acyl-CoA dehydrogenase [Actinopolyspora mortivallis]|uniref:acyl-CoA dehydrogenase n=1 Tax=Actinopolyspora mortivallis TaxID=33906 RepID=UPI0003804E8C|nr:acyl-CoA dehydrogenase [Actinopolyspora mortivallis]